MSRDLPIFELESDLVRGAADAPRWVLTAPTGSGKSTQVPQMLADRVVKGAGQVVVLQPRRIAARLLAARVARERGGRLGGETGYQVRFEGAHSAATRILFMTEGILLRRLQSDPALAGISVILFDEFHERHLQADLALGLAWRLQKTRRPDLRLGVMSATLDAEALCRYWGDCPVWRGGGRLYPVEIRHAEKPYDFERVPCWTAAAETLARVWEAGADGDALVFLPGAYEINRAVQAIRAMPAFRGADVWPLHGELPNEAQDAAVERGARRKVVVATNVAETSLTIEGVRIVVDSGLARIARFDPWRGINTLRVEAISRAAAEQRAGRAGRTGPGLCERLWTAREHAGRPAAEEPEARRVDLSEAFLLLKAAGVDPAAGFDWLDAPEPRARERAETLLDDLGATAGPAGPITPRGRRMAVFPVHPRYARLMTEAEEQGCMREAAWIAALTEGRPFLARAADADTRERRERALGERHESDFTYLLEAWRQARAVRFEPDACRRLGVNGQAARQAGAAAEMYERLARKGAVAGGDDAADPERLARCVLAAFPDRVAKRMDGGTLRCQVVHGRRGTLAKESAVRHAPLLAAAEIREIETGRGELEVRLSLATAIRPEWLAEAAGRPLETRVQVAWDAAARRVVADEVLLYHDLAVESRRLARPPADAAAALLADEVARGRLALKGWDEAAEQWIRRVNLAAESCPESGLPRIGPAEREALVRRLCAGAVAYKDVKEKPVRPLLEGLLTGAQRALLERLAPDRIVLSNGRRAKVLYEAGAPPHVALRIQELYGVTETPALAKGRVPLRVHILAPSGRPVQITQDLRGFWRDAYPGIKRELQRKYPRHEWR